MKEIKHLKTQEEKGDHILFILEKATVFVAVFFKTLLPKYNEIRNEDSINPNLLPRHHNFVFMGIILFLEDLFNCARG